MLFFKVQYFTLGTGPGGGGGGRGGIVLVLLPSLPDPLSSPRVRLAPRQSTRLPRKNTILLFLTDIRIEVSIYNYFILFGLDPFSIPG